MKLFIRSTSDKTKLQKQLDCEQASRSATAVEALPVETERELGNRAIFAKPKNEAIFHVDLLGGWVKP
jgi:hypothetical protein